MIPLLILGALGLTLIAVHVLASPTPEEDHERRLADFWKEEER